MNKKLFRTIGSILLIVSSVLLIVFEILPFLDVITVELHNTMYAISMIGIGISFVLLGIYQLLKRNQANDQAN